MLLLLILGGLTRPNKVENIRNRILPAAIYAHFFPNRSEPKLDDSREHWIVLDVYEAEN